MIVSIYFWKVKRMMQNLCVWDRLKIEEFEFEFWKKKTHSLKKTKEKVKRRYVKYELFDLEILWNFWSTLKAYWPLHFKAYFNLSFILVSFVGFLLSVNFLLRFFFFFFCFSFNWLIFEFVISLISWVFLFNLSFAWFNSLISWIRISL